VGPTGDRAGTGLLRISHLEHGERLRQQGPTVPRRVFGLGLDTQSNLGFGRFTPELGDILVGTDAGVAVEEVVVGDDPDTSLEPEASLEPDGEDASDSLVATDQQGEGRFLRSGKEAGTAPEDRSFRPDVEGLRGVAILLVVLFHAWWLPLNGGYVGVDVFFVISGFVITGLLLRERAASNHTSLLSFYARRLRRIVPMASLVIIAAVVATHFLLGKPDTTLAESDGRWALAFLANIHVFPSGLIGVHRPPSAIQQYWSLGIEEQFYMLYPTLFLVVALVASRWSLRAKLAVVLSAPSCSARWSSRRSCIRSSQLRRTGT
jgi:hypothetical protein